jgi:hypothetical protein
MKRRFKILQGRCEYSLETQVRLFPALCALQNFIIANDDGDIVFWDTDDEASIAEPELTGYNVDDFDGEIPDLHGNISAAEKERAEARRDRIAHAMWRSYQEELRCRDML